MNARYAEASLITGLARSARSDNEALHLATLDLDPCQKSAEDTARIILSILHTSVEDDTPQKSLEQRNYGWISGPQASISGM